jgi:hypothetical protein
MALETLQQVMNALREARAFGLRTELEWHDQLERVEGPVMAAIGQGTGGEAAAGEGEGAGGGGAGGGGGEGAGAGGEGGGEGGTDLQGLFASFRNDVLSRFDGIEERLEPEEEEIEDNPRQLPRIFDPRNFTDDDYDENGQLTPEAENRALNEAIDRQVAMALAPEREAEAARRRGEQADALETEYPIFADPEARAPVFSAAQQAAQQLAQSLGQPELRDMWREPAFLRTVYLGIVGQTAASRETVAGGEGGVTLENGGSAGPAAGSSGNANEGAAERIVKLAASTKYRLGNT